jgi:hypothetical protein
MVFMVQRYRSFDPFDLARNTVQAPARPTASPRPATRTAANDPVRPQRAAAPTDGRSVIEARYPQMACAIELLWGHAEMNLYFEKLWLADGNQGPIDPEAMSELMLLAQIHHLLVPNRPQRSLATIYGSAYARDSQRASRDIWDVEPRRR